MSCPNHFTPMHRAACPVCNPGREFTIAEGTNERTGLVWRIAARDRGTNQDLRDIAALLLEAANRLKDDPTAVDTRITA